MKKRMISFLVLLVVVFAVLPVVASAETVAIGTCGENLTWTLDGEGTLTISGTGAMINIKEDYEEDAPWYDYKDSIKKVVVENGVTTIGNRAFFNYDALTQLVAADSVTTIGTLAFFDCDKLDTVVAKGVTEVRSSAFSSCGILSNLQIYNAVSIGSEAFYMCSKLTYQSGLKQLQRVGEGAFMYSGLKTITLPDTVTYIAPFAFWDCNNLKATFKGNAPGMTDCGYTEASFASSAVFHVSCTATGDWRGYTVVLQHDMLDATCTAPKTCKNCSATEGTVNHTFASNKCTVCGVAGGQCGNKVYWTYQDSTLTLYGSGEMYSYLDSSSEIPWYSRRGNILHAVIEPGVTKLNAASFRYCEVLQDIVIADTVTSFGSNTFQYCENLKSIAIPSGTTTIPSYMFNGCSSLETVILPEGITKIGSLAFWNCTALTQITLPETLTVIGDQAFLRTGLKKVEIPASVTKLEAWAFSTCANLNTIVFKGDAPTFGSTISDGSFENKVFNELTATVYYPADNDTWTDSVMQNYGGDITWSKLQVGTCGENLTWALDEEGTLTISGTGDMDDYEHWGPWNDYRSSVKKVVIEEGVTSIGRKAFYSCGNMISVTIPGSVQRIGYEAFYRCFALTSVTIPDSVTSIGNRAFLNCSGLTSVTLPSGITAISESAFGYCRALTSITIPNSVTMIGNKAFEGCSALTAVTIPNAVTSVGANAFYGCGLISVTVPAGVTSIGEGAFGSCKNLTGIWVAENNANYSSDASGVLFDKAKTVLMQAPCAISGSYTMPNSVTTIDRGAFSGCNKLTGITIPAGVTAIGNYAFYQCSALSAVTLPSGVTAIGPGTFYMCSSLASVSIPDTVGSIGENAFHRCIALTSVAIPNGVAQIGFYAFSECDGLTAVTLPDSMQSIGNHAFMGCDRLASVTVPSGITTIEAYTFSDCYSLTEVTIPSSVITIAPDAFDYCTSLTDVYYKGTQDQWDAITVGTDNEHLLNATLYTRDSALKFSGASLTLQSNLAVNYKADKALLEQYGFTDPYVIVEMNGRQTKLTQYTVEGDKYAFSFRNIAPHQMGDTLTATLYATYNGVEISGQTRDYSVTEYCYSMLDKYADNVKFRTLLVDLLHYGAASQNYTGYKADSLVDKDLTAAQQQWGTSSDPALNTVKNTAYKTVENPIATWKGAGLYLEDRVSIRLNFVTESIDGVYVRIESGGNTWTISSDKFQLKDGRYYVYFDGLDAGQMRQAVYLTIYRGETPVSNTACYSIESYVYEKQNNADLSVLLKAMMKYGDSAHAYAN